LDDSGMLRLKGVDSAAKGWSGPWRFEARTSWGEAWMVLSWENLELMTVGMASAEEFAAKAPKDWLAATAAGDAVADPAWASNKATGASQTRFMIARSFIKHL